MERFSNRESVLLGYSPQRTFANYPITSPNHNSDIDFNDVFGGPPRRASIQETRCSFAESTDTCAFRKSDDQTSSHRHGWSGLSEKPVFGEEGVNRRRYPSQDFFDDIFRGNESFCSSPRKNDRSDPFCSSPGSRVLSPTRPLPPRAEPFASSSLPAQFSLPAKLIKGTDLPTFGSSGRYHHKIKDGTSNGISFYPSSPLSRFSIQTNQVQEEESRNDVCLQSSSSQEPSLSSEDWPYLAKPDELEKTSNLKKDSTISNQFHFSIYKWASKGVPLPLPLRGANGLKSKEKIKLERALSASGQITCEGMAKELSAVTPQDIDHSTFNNSISSDGKPSEIEFNGRENGYLFNTSTHSGVEQVTNAEEAVLPKSDSQNPNTLQEDTEHQSILDKGLSGKIERVPVATSTQEASKNEMKTLRSLLKGNHEIAVKNELKENKVKSTKKSAAVFDVSEKVKKGDGKGTILNGEEMDKANLQGSHRNSREGLAKNRDRGKVKEFVKIFNEGAFNKPKFHDDAQIQGSAGKERGQFKTQDRANSAKTKVNEKVHMPNANKNDIIHASAVVDEFLKQSDKQHSSTRTNNHTSMDISSGLKDRPASTAAISDGSEATIADLDDSFQGNILIKELPQDEDGQRQAGDNQEEIQVIDASIRKWSNGKEANIRSLLSTLQYVLWPESGWKPVPLVDIIEGNAVKRSYQKALLSLHPDKLQQKGATSHQKYIAEKVFDILQEAWTHFSSAGLL